MSEVKELREFALSIKNAAPERIIAERGLEERWKVARKKALTAGKGEIPLTYYLDCESGSYVLAYVLGVHDVAKGTAAAEIAVKQLNEMSKKGPIYTPRGTNLMDPRSLAEKMS